MTEEVSLPTAAARLGVSWHVAYRLALSGQLGPLIRRGNYWRLQSSGVVAFTERIGRQAGQHAGAEVE